jgi:hypothetical protein
VRTKGFELVLVGFHVDDSSTSGHVRGEDDIVFAYRDDLISIARSVWSLEVPTDYPESALHDRVTSRIDPFSVGLR